MTDTNTLRDALQRQVKPLRDALLHVARLAEALKRPCSEDPESSQAILNGRYASIALTAHIALGTVRGPAAPPAPLEALPPHQGCEVPPVGWWCSRAKGHLGPCAARPGLPPDAPSKALSPLSPTDDVLRAFIAEVPATWYRPEWHDHTRRGLAAAIAADRAARSPDQLEDQ